MSVIEDPGVENGSKDSVFFLVKDPHWTFVWWEVSQDTLRKISEDLGMVAREAQLFLRIHDVTDIIFDGNNAHSWFDVEITGQTDHWYLHVPVAGRNYCAELVFKARDRLAIAARSNTACLPKDGPIQPLWIP